MDNLEDYYGPSEQKSFFEKFKEHIVDFIQTLVVFGAIFAIIYLFVAQPHKVSGSSMVPTFKSGEYILTEKISYRFGTPKKGDIIVLENPRNESQDFIKRIITTPKDLLRIEEGFVYINGQRIFEPYLSQATTTRAGSFLEEGAEIKVGPNQYFVFGDNRNSSSDSREWGPVSKQEIVGKVFFRYWPPKSFGPITKTP